MADLVVFFCVAANAVRGAQKVVPEENISQLAESLKCYVILLEIKTPCFLQALLDK